MVYDKVGNYKSIRWFVLFDSNLYVLYNLYEYLCVDIGLENINYMWVVDNIIIIEVIWKKRFWNVLYDYNKWLNEILESYGIVEVYDDYIGIRNVIYIKNVYGEKFFIKNELYIYNF